MDTIKLDVTHSSLGITMPEIRFSRSESVATAKQSLERRVGTSAESMKLVLKDRSGNTIASLDNEEASLGSYGAVDGYILHVIDTNPLSMASQLSDISQVPKYVIEEDKYNARQDTFVKFKEKNPELFKPKPKIDDTFEADKAAAIKVGNRCQVIKMKLRGEVKFVGKMPEKAPGFWVGVLLDEPLGESNGTYFLARTITLRIVLKERTTSPSRASTQRS